jgi:SSS family transporter
MIFTTVLGEKLSGKQATIKDFFLGGKSIPWWAVTGSMIATEISALTFIGVPGGVYAAQGDWTYLQWGIGSIIARFAIGYWLVPLYFEKEIYSPYDFIGNRLGEGVRRLVTALFSLGAVLGASVRVVVTAVILRAVTGLDPFACITIIGVFAVLWTFLGGMQTVIWTDVIQFCLFIFGGVLALVWLVSSLGWDQIWNLNQVVAEDGEPVNKMRIFNLASPFTEEGRALKYTLWVGLLAMPFQNFAAFGIDQLNTQRMFCCGSASDARKAMCWSSVSILITVVMLAVGSGLFAWYQVNAPNAGLLAAFEDDTNNVFPAWIVTVVPAGLSGLILGGAFAAAISSLDSTLAALSQTTLSIFYGREKLEDESKGKERVTQSRIAVCIWGVILTLVTIGLWIVYDRNDDSDLIGLAFGMVAYTFGPLLGILMAAIFLRGRHLAPGLIVGSCLSILFVGWFRPEILIFFQQVDLPEVAKWIEASRPALASEWFFPLNAGLTFLCGWLGKIILQSWTNS